MDGWAKLRFEQDEEYNLALEQHEWEQQQEDMWREEEARSRKRAVAQEEEEKQGKRAKMPPAPQLMVPESTTDERAVRLRLMSGATLNLTLHRQELVGTVLQYLRALGYEANQLAARAPRGVFTEEGDFNKLPTRVVLFVE